MVRRVCGGWLATQTRNYCQLFDCHWRTDWRTQQRDLEGEGDLGRTCSKGLAICVGCLWPTLLTFARMYGAQQSLSIGCTGSSSTARLAIKSLTVAAGLVLVEVLGPQEPRPPTPDSEQPTCCAGIPHWRNCDKFKCGFLVVRAWQELWGELNEFVLVNGPRSDILYWPGVSQPERDWSTRCN